MKWIKLTDKEPKFGEKYLLLNESKRIGLGLFTQKIQKENSVDYFFIMEDGQDEPSITHYMKIDLPK